MLKVLPFVFSFVASVILTFLLQSVDCMFRECVDDDTGRMAVGLFGIFIGAFYFIISSLIVYPVALFLSRHFRKIIASLPIPIFLSLLSTYWFAVPEMPVSDFVYRKASVFLLFFLPWLLGGYLFIRLWPKKSEG